MCLSGSICGIGLLEEPYREAVLTSADLREHICVSRYAHSYQLANDIRIDWLLVEASDGHDEDWVRAVANHGQRFLDSLSNDEQIVEPIVQLFNACLGRTGEPVVIAG